MMPRPVQWTASGGITLIGAAPRVGGAEGGAEGGGTHSRHLDQTAPQTTDNVAGSG